MLDLPPALHDAIRLQLDGLTIECRDVMTAAAVIGREFDLKSLAIAANRDRRALLEILDEASRAKLVSAVPSPIRGRYSFAHVLVRDCLYESLGALDRSTRHYRLAMGLEEIHGSSAGPHLPAVAFHFRSALPIGSIEKAIAYSERSGAYSLERLAYSEAASEFRHAISLLGDEADASQRCELLLSLSDALVRAGDLEGARGVCRTAISLGRESGSADFLGRAAFALSPGFFSIETALYDEELVALLEEALKATELTGTPALRVRLLSHLASSLYWTDQVERRRSLSERAMELIDSSSDPSTLAYALYARHRSLWSPDNIEDRTHLARRAVAIGEELNDRESTLLHRALLITDLAEAGEVKDLDEEIVRFETGAEELHQLQSLWLAPMFRAMRALMAGRFRDSIALANQYRALGLRIGSIDAENCWAGQLAISNWELGNGEAMLPLMRAHAEANPRIAIFGAAVVFMAAETGRIDDAQANFEVFAESRFQSIPRDMNWLGTMLLLSTACARLRHAEWARALLELLHPYRDRFAVLGYSAIFMGAVAAHIGRLAAISGDRTLARDLLVQGREMNHRVGAAAWEARAVYDHAVESLQWGDVSSAKRLLETAERLTASSEMIELRKRIPQTAEHCTARCASHSA
jgi:tetratricopeptide (TPR) repeat protein